MTDLDLTPAMPAEVHALDLSGAIDTSGVTTTDVIAAVAIAVVTLIVALIVGHLTRQRLSRPDTNTIQLARFGATAARWVIIFVGGSISLSFLGLEVSWFTATIVLVIIVVVLIARPLLEKYSAGVALATASGFGIGDEVGVKDFEGEVIEITGRSTVLRLRNGKRVHIPNTEMIEQDIIVFTTDQKRRTEIELEVDGRYAVESVERVILDALDAVAEIEGAPAPYIRARGFGVAAVTLSVRIWHKSDLHSGSVALDQAVRAIARGLEAAGMGIANPALEVLRPGPDAEPAEQSR